MSGTYDGACVPEGVDLNLTIFGSRGQVRSVCAGREGLTGLGQEYGDEVNPRHFDVLFLFDDMPPGQPARCKVKLFGLEDRETCPVMKKNKKKCRKGGNGLKMKTLANRCERRERAKNQKYVQINTHSTKKMNKIGVQTSTRLTGLDAFLLRPCGRAK
jgi:hypothetical protein